MTNNSTVLTTDENSTYSSCLDILNDDKSVGDGFSVGASGSLNRISKLGDVSADDLSYYAIDALIKAYMPLTHRALERISIRQRLSGHG